MSNVCCKEFTGWVKSFTKVERALTILEAILLVVLIALLILLILHLIVCSKPYHRDEDTQNFPMKKIATYEGHEIPIENSATETGKFNTSRSSNRSSAQPGVKCSWTPSAKTTAAVHYYEDDHSQSSHIKTPASKVNKTTYYNGQKSSEASKIATKVDVTTYISTPYVNEVIDSEMVESDNGVITSPENIEKLIKNELSDGEQADDDYDRHVAALVKLKPPKDVIFGCILTIVSDYWTLTAASCIEAIEETDSLDSFVIMEHYGTDNKEPVQAIDDVQIHPLYEGKNKTYDLAALKSSRSLTRGSQSPIELVPFLDFALLTLAHKFIILGYGAFRTIDSGPAGRRLRQAHVYKVPVRQCARGAAGAALRHLSGGSAVPRGACGPPALCAGVLYSRGLPCNYCAGTPLLLLPAPPAPPAPPALPALLGLMADNDQCAVACEPALYVNLADADIADWVDATLRSDIDN